MGLAALEHGLTDFVVLFVDVRDALGARLMKTLEEAFGRSFEPENYVAACIGEGRHPVVAVPKETSVVCSWFERDLSDIATRLRELHSDTIIRVLVIAPGTMTIFDIPAHRLALWLTQHHSRSE